MTEADLISIIIILLVVLILVAGYFVKLCTSRVENRLSLLQDKVNNLDEKLKKETEKNKEKVFVEGCEWDIKDTRTGESFLKLIPDNTDMTRMELAYLLLEIKDYLNDKMDNHKDFLEDLKRRHW